VVNRPIARYSPSRRYALFALAALLAVIPSAWASTHWGMAWIAAAVLFGVTAGLTLLLALRPRIEIFENCIIIGGRRIFWAEIHRVDRISVGSSEPWTAPLLLRLTIAGGEEVMIFHPGDVDSCVSLLRHIYRNARAALLDGVNYSEFWGEAAPPSPTRMALPRPRLLLAEDEEEVERMFQQLRTAGRLDDSANAGHAVDQADGSDES
jgi:hypothetical protein